MGRSAKKGTKEYFKAMHKREANAKMDIVAFQRAHRCGLLPPPPGMTDVAQSARTR